MRDMSLQVTAMNEGYENDFCTVPEAARLLDVSPVTVWRWIESDKLPAYRVGPRNIRIKRQDLEAMIKPAGPKEVDMRRQEAPSETVTEEELARRKRLVARIVARRKGRVISPLTTAELVRKVREEETRSHER